MKKKPTKWSDVPIGTRFVVVANSNGNNYPRDQELSVEYNPPAAAAVIVTGYNTLKISDVRFVNQTREILIKDRDKACKELERINSILAYMDENGLKEYDPKLHFFHNTMKLLKQKKGVTFEEVQAALEPML